MNEIEKMYENAGIKSEWRYTVHQFCHFYEADKEDILRHKYLFKERKTARIKKAEKKYPPFTAEKQLELIKWLGELDMLEITRTIREDKAWIINSEFGMSGNVYKHTSRMKSFEEALAELINSLWQDITEEEKEQIREILR